MSNEDTKLITFRAPTNIVDNFDTLIKLKRSTRTSQLVEFMDTYIREEFKRIEESNRINDFISNIKSQG